MDDPAVQQLAQAFARTVQHDRVMQGSLTKRFIDQRCV
jgi:hypothetical protein